MTVTDRTTHSEWNSIYQVAKERLTILSEELLGATSQPLVNSLLKALDGIVDIVVICRDEVIDNNKSQEDEDGPGEPLHFHQRVAIVSLAETVIEDFLVDLLDVEDLKDPSKEPSIERSEK